MGLACRYPRVKWDSQLESKRWSKELTSKCSNWEEINEGRGYCGVSGEKTTEDDDGGGAWLIDEAQIRIGKLVGWEMEKKRREEELAPIQEEELDVGKMGRWLLKAIKGEMTSMSVT